MHIDLTWPNKRLERRLAKASRSARASAIRFLGEMFQGMEGQLVHELWMVQQAISSRMIHLHSAIMALLDNRYASVAAIVALTQFELRLDALYVNTQTDTA